MKKLLIVFTITLTVAILYACGNQNNTPVAQSTEKGADVEKASNGNPSYDPHRGEGKFKKVELSPTINATMAENGNKVYNVKCSGCHKLTEEKLVGPGWKGLTSRHTAEWIMNFMTNTEAMLDKDPNAQAQLEICLVRMPNQNLTDDDARSLYELQRKVDVVK